MNYRGEAGNGGNKALRDCRAVVEWADKTPGAWQVRISRDGSGGAADEQLQELCVRVGSFFGLSGALVSLDTNGAPDWVVAARVEAALKQADPALAGDFNLEDGVQPARDSSPDALRRSRLYVPGDCPRFMLKAAEAGADGVIFDLEDAVSPARKHSARILVRNALRHADLGASERMVRINPFPLGLEDLKAVIPHGVHLILLPKCESAEQVVAVADEIRSLVGRSGRTTRVFLLPIIESALGVERAFEVATSAPDVVALTLGLEDYTADLGVRRTPGGAESLWARQRLVNAAAAAGVQALDSVSPEFRDLAALRAHVLEARALGYVGKGCIHPAQVPVVHEAFAPSEEEIAYARRVMHAFDEARAQGQGAVALEGKMIDPPVVARAEAVIASAKKMGIFGAE